MANYNIRWTASSKGNDQLIVDEYILHTNGKGKTPGVAYWICSSPGCSVKAKTHGNHLVSVTGVVNPPDHGHINNNSTLDDSNLTVSYYVILLYLFHSVIHCYST